MLNLLRYLLLCSGFSEILYYDTSRKNKRREKFCETVRVIRRFD